MAKVSLLLAVGLVLLQPSPAPAAPPLKNILLLYPHERERALYDALDDGLRSALQSGSRYSVNSYTEYLDLIRFQSEAQQAQTMNYVRTKYAKVPLDLIVAVSPLAVDWIAERRDDLFPGVPIVFTSVNQARATELVRDWNTTGIGVNHDLTMTLDVALHVQPEALRVVIPAGTSPIEQRWMAATRESLRPYEKRLEVIFLTDLTMSELEQRLSELPDRTIVLVAGLFYYDSAGEYFLPEESLRRISQAANAPVYGLNLPELGLGILGGSLYDLGASGAAAGLVAQRVLSGQDPWNIPLQTLNADVTAFDARALRRFHIDESRLPPGSRVRFRPPSLWRDYRQTVLVAIAVAVTQTLLIVVLLVEYRRRRAAELRSRRDLANIALIERRGAMGHLTGSIAHELYQPLGAILRNAEAGKMMVASSSPPSLEEIKEIFEDIRRDDKRAGDVIQRIRTLLQKHELEERLVDVNDVVRETIALLGPDATGRGVRIDADIAARPSEVMGDRVQLQQVILNLMLNGMDAMAAVPAEQRWLFVRTRSADGCLDVSIEDRGEGISLNPPSKIFEPFFTTKAQGMGMGLSIARDIIEAHGGSLSVENNRKAGATLRFSLPLVRSDVGRATA
jgi:signal transduction histidine kinase